MRSTRGWAEGRMATTEHRMGLQEVAGEGRPRGVHLVLRANRPSTGTRLPQPLKPDLGLPMHPVKLQETSSKDYSDGGR